jgi:hypothetical protein
MSIPPAVVLGILLRHRLRLRHGKIPYHLYYHDERESIFGKLLKTKRWLRPTDYLVIKERIGWVEAPYSEDDGAPIVKCDFYYSEQSGRVSFDKELEVFRIDFFKVVDPKEKEEILAKVGAARKDARRLRSLHRIHRRKAVALTALLR